MHRNSSQYSVASSHTGGPPLSPNLYNLATAASSDARPNVSRRASAITWQDASETNSISVPSLLKKEVATSKAGRVKPAVEKLASWFKGSPQNLEEIEEAKEDDRQWKKRVRKWKKARAEQDDEDEDVDGDSKLRALVKYMKRKRKESLCG